MYITYAYFPYKYKKTIDKKFSEILYLLSDEAREKLVQIRHVERVSY